MQVNTFLEGLVDGSERRAPVNGGEPTGIAVGQDIDGAARLGSGNLPDQVGAVAADGFVDRDVLVAQAAAST